MNDTTDKFNFADALNKLEDINNWFQSEDIDLDEGLSKLKEGRGLIKKCRDRLQNVENEFEKIKTEFDEDHQTEQSEVEEKKDDSDLNF